MGSACLGLLASWHVGLILLLAVYPWTVSSGLPSTIKLGGLFENGDDTAEIAFRDAIERINSDLKLLPNTRIEAVIEKLERCDSFQASKRGK